MTSSEERGTVVEVREGVVCLFFVIFGKKLSGLKRLGLKCKFQFVGTTK